jgi:superfamily II DNA or RNA helicase
LKLSESGISAGTRSPVRLRELTLAPAYNTEENDIVRDLYAPCLKCASSYDRAVGYFRANIYRELGEELLDFAIRGGKVRIVCSPDIPEADESAARKGYADRGNRAETEIEASLIETLERMATFPDEADCLEMLRLLIESSTLELFIAVRPGGIYHRKVGAFADRYGDSVVFSGSGNETTSAVTTIEDWANDEEFDVFRSWGETFEQEKAKAKRTYLERLFAGGTEHTRVRPLDQVEREVLSRFRHHDQFESLREGARRRAPKPRNELLPRPYYYQEQAIGAWDAAGRKGILSMATGTGKTLTALFAVRSLVEQGLPVVILVPSKILFSQWLEEIRKMFPGVPTLLVGAGNDWKADPLKTIYVSKNRLPRIILATMQSAATDDFLEFIRQAESPVLIADEVHRLGSPVNRKLLTIPFSAKLGLSATPERLFDPEGSRALEEAFGSEPVFDLPIGGAVRLSASTGERTKVLGRFLCKYSYDFEVARLNSQEQERWNEITREVRRIFARKRGLDADEVLDDPNLQNLLIQRARIVKKAGAKPDLALQIIHDRYPRDGHWIVYCDDEEQLDSVALKLRSAEPHLTVLTYHSKMSNEERERTLRYFAELPSIIVAIRCLDEGVNVPGANGGVILASSTNPREYVQRRGRILRTALGKRLAQVVDVLVVPQENPEEAEFPGSIVRSELARAYKFAKDAVNPEVTHRLWRLCQEYNVQPEADTAISITEEEESD